jgi:hypothetical protein
MLAPGPTLALLGSGGFLLFGLLTGVWKYRHMWRSADAEAPFYVDTAHRASLLYAFAALVIYEFATFSPYGTTATTAAVAVPLFFFAAAVASYVVHGLLRDTDNQFRAPYRLGDRELPPWVVNGAMWLLVVGEIGGFGVLFVGFLQSVVV